MLLTKKDAAKRLGVSPQTVDRLVRDGELETIRDNTVDYLGFSYYFSNVCKYQEGHMYDGGALVPGGAKAANEYCNEFSPDPWRFRKDPKGFRILIEEYADRYHLPLFIAENGIGLYEDESSGVPIQDPERIKKGVSHKLEVIVTDNCGNETRKQYKF